MSKITNFTPTHAPGKTSYENPIHRVPGGDTSGVRAAKTLSDVSAAKGPAANPPAQNTGFAASVAKSAATGEAASLGDRYAEAGEGFEKPSKTSDFLASVSGFFKGLGSGIRSMFVSLGESIGSLFSASGRMYNSFTKELETELADPRKLFRENSPTMKAFTVQFAKDSPQAAAAMATGYASALASLAGSAEYKAMGAFVDKKETSGANAARGLMGKPEFTKLVFEGVKMSLQSAFGDKADNYASYVGKLGNETRTFLAKADDKFRTVGGLDDTERSGVIERWNSNNHLLRGAAPGMAEAMRKEDLPVLDKAILLTMHKVIVAAAGGAGAASKDFAVLTATPDYAALKTDIQAMLSAITAQIKTEV